MESRESGSSGKAALAAGLSRLLRAAGAALLPLLLFVSSAAVAADASSRVPQPTLEKGKGEKCVADTEFMRRNHMKMLLHQRDETMHRGIRTTRFSLKGCIDCHASKKTGSVIGSNENFCQSCHAYAAVKIDCFECHASKPGSSPTAEMNDSRAGLKTDLQPDSRSARRNDE